MSMSVPSSICRSRSHPAGAVTADEMREMQWVRPELVAQIRLVEWTAEGRLRHAAFPGSALRQERARRATGGERRPFVTVSVQPGADARATLVSCIPARVSRTADARRRGDVRDLR